MLRVTSLQCFTLSMIVLLAVRSASGQFAATEAEIIATEVENLDYNVLTGEGDLVDLDGEASFGPPDYRIIQKQK